MSVGVFLAGNMATSNDNVVKFLVESLTDFLPNEDFVLIDKYKSDKLARSCYFRSVKFIPDDITGWKDARKQAKDILEKEDISTLLLLKLPIYSNFNYNDCSVGGKFFDKENDQYAFNYVSMKNFYFFLTLVDVASSICDHVYHYVIDPDEARLEQIFHFKNFSRLYFIDGDDYDLAPYWNYRWKQMSKFYEVEKCKDFVFYCSLSGNGRDWLRSIKDDLESNCSLDINLCDTNRKGKGKKAFVKQDDYFAMLASSKATAVIPSYNPATFSWQRFCEAVWCNCLPYVFRSCNLSEIEKSFPDIYDIINSELLVDGFYEIERKLKDKDFCSKSSEVLKAIKESESMQKLTDIDSVRSYWNKKEW